MVYFGVLWLILCGFSHLLMLTASGLHDPRGKIHDGQSPAHRGTTASKWRCYKDEFAHAPDDSFQAPCLRLISPPLGAVTPSGGARMHPFRLQVHAGEAPPSNTELRWMIIVPAIRKGERGESYPVQGCRDKISCDVYVPPDVYYHGNPFVVVTGSYKRTPWMKTILPIPLKKQVEEEALLVLPRQLWQYHASQQQQQVLQLPITPHRSRQDSYEVHPLKNEGGLSESYDGAQMREAVNPGNPLVPHKTPVPRVPRVRRVRRGKNNPTSQQRMRTSHTLSKQAGQVRMGGISSNKWQQGGDSIFQPQSPSRRERRERLHGKVKAVNINPRRIRRQQLSARPYNAKVAHQISVSRPETRPGYVQQTSANVRSHQTGLQPLQTRQRSSKQSVGAYPWQGHATQPGEYPIQHPSPSTNDIYLQRIRSAFSALQRLQSSWHHKEEQDHQRHERKKSRKRQRSQRDRLLEELHDLREDHISRLNRYSPGESHEIRRKPSRIVPNYYPIIPHRPAQQETGTTAPNVTTTMAPTETTPTPTFATTAAAPTTESTTETSPTTASSPLGGRPLSIREKMRMERLRYKGLRAEAAKLGRRDSSPYERLPSTYRVGGQIPGSSKFETSPLERGLSRVEDNEGLSDDEPVSGEKFPETSDYEEAHVRLSQEGTTSHNPLVRVSSDDPQNNTPRRDFSPGNINELDSHESWDEYSELLPANYDDEIEENDLNEEDGADEIYDTSVSMDTWGETKRDQSKRDRRIVDEINRRMPNEDDSVTKQFIADKYMPELDMPLNEQTFRVLKEEIINEERKVPENQEGNIPRYVEESSNIRQNVPQQNQYFVSSFGNEQLRLPSAFRSVKGNQVAPARASRTVQEESAFETSASEPKEYSYNPSSDLSELGTAAGDAMGDIEERSLDEKKFLALQEEILAEERVRVGHRADGEHSSNGESSGTAGSDDIKYKQLQLNDRIGSMTVTNRNDLVSPNNPQGSGWHQSGDVNPEDSFLEVLGQVNNNNVELDVDRPLAMEPGLTPSPVGTEGTREDYLSYDPVSKEDQVSEGFETQSEEWSEWSQCTHSCGHGTKTRHRACTGPNTGTCSSGVESHVIKCALQRCSGDWEGTEENVEEESLSQWSDWSGWIACSVSCGSGLSRRERVCLLDPDQELGCLGQREESRSCQLEDCKNDEYGAIPGGGTTRRSDHGHHGHHTKRIKCHLDESRSHLPMELFWTSPSGEKITHAMTHEEDSKYRIEGTTLVVTEDKPTEGSYHCIVIYGGSSGSKKKGKTVAMGGCQSNPCHHKGICLDQPGPYNVSYRCLCPAGYEGMTCHMAPYLKGDVIVLSLLGWFIVSSAVIILVVCLCCSKQMKKRKMKKKLELDDAPAEKLLAKILPNIETLNNPDITSDEDTKPLLGFRPPPVAIKPPSKNVKPTEPEESPYQTGKDRFKNFVNKITKTTGKKVEASKGFAFPTLKDMKSLNKELKEQINKNNSNKLDSSISEDDSLTSDTALSSSCESLPEGNNAEGFSPLANHNMNNCTWDYSNASSCVPCDLNTSSIVGNDSLLEISTDDFRDFKVANAFSVFKGSSSTQRNQAMIDPSMEDDSSSSIPVFSTSLPGEVPQGYEKHPMFHFEPTSPNSTGTLNCSTEPNNDDRNGGGSVSVTRSPWRRERPWLMRTPPRQGNGVRVRLPPSPTLSVSPSRLRLPPSPTGQRLSRMFGSTDEHAILKRYCERRTATHPQHAKSHVAFENGPQETLGDHLNIDDCHRKRNGNTSGRPSISSSHDTLGSFGATYRDNTRSSSGSGNRQQYSIATRIGHLQDPKLTGTVTVEKPSKQRRETNRSLFSSPRVHDSTMPSSQDIHQPFSLDKSCTTSSDYDFVSMANQGAATTNVMTFGFPEYTNTMSHLFASPNFNNR